MMQTASSDALPLSQLPYRFPYQFQQWPISRESSPLHERAGWHGLFAKLCQDVDRVLSPTQRRSFSWVAVRKVDGAMRCYYAGELNAEVTALVKRAERESTRLCAVCAGDGTRRCYGGVWASRCAYHGVRFAACRLLLREPQLRWAQERQLERHLAQWLHTPDPRWGDQTPAVYCATATGATMLLEQLMLQLEPPPALH